MIAKGKLVPLLLGLIVGVAGVLLLSPWRILWLESSSEVGPPVIEPQPLTSTQPSQGQATIVSPASSLAVQPLPNSLRVSNRTQFPIRLVLLSHQVPEAKPLRDDFQQPVHWDFEPMEGGMQGLLLSLPERTLTLQSGDVLMGFALDGSKRYWGPFIVGQTPMPVKKGHPLEWQLSFTDALPQ